MMESSEVFKTREEIHVECWEVVGDHNYGTKMIKRLEIKGEELTKITSSICLSSLNVSFSIELNVLL